MAENASRVGLHCESTNGGKQTKSGRILVVGSVGAAGMTLAARLTAKAEASGASTIPLDPMKTIYGLDTDLINRNVIWA